MTDLTGKVAFIANAETPTGRACAAKLAEAGATVWSSGPAENTSADSWASAFQSCIADTGRLDVLVIPTNGEASGPLMDLKLEAFVTTHRGMAVPAFLAQNQGILAMRALGNGGAVIHVIPAAARSALDGAVAACAASAGILFSSKSAALECAKAKDGIVVNAVLAGPVEGEAGLPYPPGIANVSSNAVADAVLFYAAEGAEYMSGMDLPVDDGYLAQ